MSETDSAVVDNLVTQFSSPLHCFRELVQNSIDAGSPTVDVWTEFIEGDGHTGTIALHVDDYGEGMDEHIIDEELTRLFASSKEQDLTKIGQFGIGFVSTFALEPEAILVETGRSGEYWEVLFHEDRSFTKTKLDVPVEGTQVTIFLSGDVHRYAELARGIRETLSHWCNHSDTEVTFEDRTPVDGSRSELVTINDPFEIGGDCMVRAEHEGTEIVVAYSDTPVYGFYNRGLTLALTKTGADVLGEARAERLGHVAFKIKSRYLEHTLSRETVMRDANYEKAMKLLGEAHRGPLFDRLVAELEAVGTTANWTLNEVDRYRRLCHYLAQEPAARLSDIEERPIFRMADGGVARLQQAFEAWKRDGRVLVADEPSELADELLETGLPVFLGGFWTSGDLGDRKEPVRTLISRYIRHRHESALLSRFRGFLGADIESETRRAVTSPEAVYMPVVVDEEIPGSLEPLVQRAAELLESLEAGYATLSTCTLGSPQSEPPLFVLAREAGSVMARPPSRAQFAAGGAAGRPHAAVNREHPHFETLVELWEHNPEMAAYCLAKSLLLTGDRHLEKDAELQRAARGN